VTYNSYVSQVSQNTQQRRTLELSRALSRVNWVAAIVRPVLTGQNEAISNCFSSEDWPVSKWIFQLGAMHSPSSAVESKEESFAHAMITFGKIDPDTTDCNVDLKEFGEGSGVIAQNLEQSSVLNGTGVSVDSTRQLNLLLELVDSSDRNVVVFAQHQALCSAYLSSIVVRA
jgi:hypothetical protein